MADLRLRTLERIAKNEGTIKAYLELANENERVGRSEAAKKTIQAIIDGVVDKKELNEFLIRNDQTRILKNLRYEDISAAQKLIDTLKLHKMSVKGSEYLTKNSGLILQVSFPSRQIYEDVDDSLREQYNLVYPNEPLYGDDVVDALGQGSYWTTEVDGRFINLSFIGTSEILDEEFREERVYTDEHFLSNRQRKRAIA